MPVLNVVDTGIVIAAISALSVHFLFNKYEDLIVAGQPTSLLISLVLIPGLAVPFTDVHLDRISNAIAEKALVYAVVYSTFYATLASSIVTYRLSPWHPLAGYPGPLVCRITKLWGLWIASGGKYHEYIKTLHETYGPYVRVGPNELSIVDTDAIAPILGAEGLPKGPLYSGRHRPNVQANLLCVRDRAEHLQRRRRWDKAFTTSAVKEYEEIAIKRALILVDEIEKIASANSAIVDLSQWITFFAFDFMGDMVFGGGFDLMRKGDVDGVWAMLESGMRVIALLGQIPWSSGIWFGIRSLRPPTKSAEGIRDFAVRCVSSRKQKGAMTRDIFHYLVEEAPTPPPMGEIVSDAGLSIIAGSDTTASTLANVFFYLLTNPETYANLREEVNKAFPLGEGEATATDSAKLATGMPYLNAVINEAMRMQPVVPSGSQRAVVADKTIGQHLIPAGTAVSIPIYAMHRDSRYFSPQPDAFIPERWLSPTYKATTADAEFHTTPLAFMPFSFGFANCVGKSLALVEMRLIVALLMQKFDMTLADGYEGFTKEEWLRSLEDWFVISKGRLPVEICVRKAL